MLIKLLKKDLRATSRAFLPLILGFVFVSILAKVFFEIILASTPYGGYSETSQVMTIFSILIFMLYIFYIIVYYVMTYVFIVFDFYKTIVGDHGYLTHTLPVKTGTIINSKLIIAIFWQCLTGLLIFLSFFLFAVGHIDHFIMQDFLVEFHDIVGVSFNQYLIFIVGCMIAGAFSSPLMFYVSIAIGHLFGKHKILGAILSYFGIYTVLQIVSVIILAGLGFTVSLTATTVNSTFFTSIMWFAVILSLMTSIIFYFITNFVLSRKLNLE